MDMKSVGMATHDHYARIADRSQSDTSVSEIL